MILKLKLNEERKNGLLSYSGSHNISGVCFNYSMNEQTKGPYKMRGTVRMLDNKGNIIKILKESGRPANPRDVYTQALTEKEVKEAITNAIDKLYNSYGLQIGVNAIRDISNCSFLTAVKSLGPRYLSQSKLTENTYQRKLKELSEFALMFEPKSIADISQKDIRTACNKIQNKNVKYYLKMSRDFYSYCSFRGMYRGNNVFAEYLTTNYIKQRATPDELCRKAFRKNSLSNDENKVLDEEIMTADPYDARYTAFLLCKDCGLDINTITNLKYNNIIFDVIREGSAQIIYSKSFVASAIVDYTKPCSPFASYELRRRSNAILEKYGTLDIPVIMKNTGKNLKAIEIRQFFKERLSYICGIDDKDFKSIATLDEQSGPVQLLLNHHKHTLIDYCGLEENRSTLKFLCGNSLSNNVTDNNYRSFTDIEGQTFLDTLLQRIPFNNPNERRGISVNYSNNDDITVLRYSSKDVTRKTRVDDILIELAPGQSIEIYSPTEFSFVAQKQCKRKQSKNIEGQISFIDEENTDINEE